MTRREILRRPVRLAWLGALVVCLVSLPTFAFAAEPIRPSTRLVWSDASTNLLGGPSPDGALISYVEPASGDLAVYEVATGAKRQLTSNPADAETFAYFSAFSRDSRRLAYAWFNEEGFYEIWTVDAAGGEPRRLYSNPETGFVQPCDWSLDGTKILTLFFRKDNVSQIALIDAEDGSVQVLKTLSWFYPKKISYSPNGRYILYDSIMGRGETAREILLLSADGSAEHKLVEHPANDIFPLWSPDGGAVIFASDRSGDMDLWRVAVREGAAVGEAQRVARSVGRALPMGVTRDGVYYYGLRAGRSDVVTADWEGGAVGKPTIAGLRSVGRNTAPAWSPDGSRLAFLTQMGTENYGRESRGVVIWAPSTRQETVLVPSLATVSRLRWSPDGSQLLASGSDGRGRSGLYVVDPDSGAVTGLVRRHGGDPRGLDAAWLSADSVAYVSSDRTKIQRYSLTEREEALLYEVSSGATIQQLEATADGAWLAFGEGHEDRASAVRALRASDGKLKTLLELPGEGSATALSWRNETLYLTVTQGDRPVVWTAGLDGGPAERTALDAAPPGLRFAPDGEKAAFVQSDQRSEVWALEGWMPGPAGSVELPSEASHR